MVSQDPAKFGGHRHCGSRDMMLLLAEGQDLTCLHFNPLLLSISKAHGMPDSHTQNVRTQTH